MSDDRFRELLAAVVDARARPEPTALDPATRALRDAVHAAPPADPVLAEVIRAELDGEQASPSRSPGIRRAPRSVRSARAWALAVDGARRGHLVEVCVRLWPARATGGVWRFQAANKAAELAAEAAIFAVLRAERPGWTAAWETDQRDLRLEGTSASLAVAVATRAALLGVDVPPDLAFSGEVRLDRSLARVGELPGKLAAAARAGKRAVIAGEAGPAGPTQDGTYVVATLDEAWALLPRPRALRGPVAVSAVFALLLLHRSLLEPVAAADRWIAWHLTAPLPMTHTAVLFLPEASAAVDRRDQRAEWVDLLGDLADHGAKGVVFDIYLDGPHAPTDARVAAAIRAAQERGVSVAIALSEGDDGPRPTSAPDLAFVHGGITQIDQGEWRIKVRELGSDGAYRWHLGVLGAEMLLGEEPRVDAPPDDQTLRLGGDVPLDIGRMDLDRFRVDPPLDRSELSGVRARVVFVGIDSREDRKMSPDGAVSGTMVHAMATETLLGERHPRRLPPWSSPVASVAAHLAGWRWRWRALLVLVLLVGGALAFDWRSPVVFPLAALFLGWGLSCATSRWGPSGR